MDYLQRYADRLDADIRTRTRVQSVTADGPHYIAHLTGDRTLAARVVVAATGGFSRPHRPALAGLDTFTGTVLHAADYRTPAPFAGKRVIVVGAGNSAVQIAAELADHARVTLATRDPIKFVPQRPLGRDLHFWFRVTGIDALPIGHWVARTKGRPPTVPVFDDGRYRAALVAGRPDRRPMFTGIDGPTVTWPDGTREDVEVILPATGYRPDLDYLAPLGALTGDGHPLHKGGLSTTCPGVGYVGLEWQRSLSSASLRGVGRDAAHIAPRLAAHARTRHPRPRSSAAS
ncbi:hypothetical protein Acsp04_60060 [Actinomadura sp. NBRC 104425]|uniref:flavin-containing monooxygenase n=1 Tax=Actinomadura sp. NBRC 104425 TaxID=3032204 RepID=UPI0024A2815E|nr:NAD(P)/FAD-dependent oxidoreductase [Actinomadura sp. NBRC 104425]GLZ15771.1 hypothetical protein Acsp04_60060 [Actinomadura sp. NBRC 104425]